MCEILKQRQVEFGLGSTVYFCRDQECDAHVAARHDVSVHRDFLSLSSTT